MGSPTKVTILFIRDQEEGSGFQLYLELGNLPVPYGERKVSLILTSSERQLRKRNLWFHNLFMEKKINL